MSEDEWDAEDARDEEDVTKDGKKDGNEEEEDEMESVGDGQKV